MTFEAEAFSWQNAAFMLIVIKKNPVKSFIIESPTCQAINPRSEYDT